MAKNLFIKAIRNLRKNKAYYAINVLGLALGVACCLIIFVIVRFETSFDDYHSKVDRIYRVNSNQQTPYVYFCMGAKLQVFIKIIRI